MNMTLSVICFWQAEVHRLSKQSITNLVLKYRSVPRLEMFFFFSSFVLHPYVCFFFLVFSDNPSLNDNLNHFVEP